MAAPDVTVVTAYLGDTSWNQDAVQAALDAEAAAQAAVVRVSVGAWPSDLVEALCRRVARNLATRALPLGFQTSTTDAAVAVTRLGADPEVRRLEAPYRRLVCG